MTDDTDIYRVMFKTDRDPEWRKLYTRNNGQGFYTKLSSAENAIKQIRSHVTETKIQKLEALDVGVSAGQLIWLDLND